MRIEIDKKSAYVLHISVKCKVSINSISHHECDFKRAQSGTWSLWQTSKEINCTLFGKLKMLLLFSFLCVVAENKILTRTVFVFRHIENSEFLIFLKKNNMWLKADFVLPYIMLFGKYQTFSFERKSSKILFSFYVSYKYLKKSQIFFDSSVCKIINPNIKLGFSLIDCYFRH